MRLIIGAVLCLHQNISLATGLLIPQDIILLTMQYSYSIFSMMKKKEKSCVINIILIIRGRFQPQKNQEFLVEIFSRYLKQDNNAILMLIGQGENEDKVKQRISELGINDKVMLMGVRQDVNELLQAMDVFVLPSLFEGLGMVLIEAQAAGLPCVTSKDVVPDIVNVTGNVSFVPLNNNADEWAQKIYDTLQKTYERNKSIPMLTEAGYDIARETDRFAEYISE